MPLLEAVERAALRAGVPVDARIEKGRTPPTPSALLWDVERFDRDRRAGAPTAAGFTAKDLTWLLEHAPAETLVLKPRGEAVSSDGTERSSGSLRLEQQQPLDIERPLVVQQPLRPAEDELRHDHDGDRVGVDSDRCGGRRAAGRRGRGNEPPRSRAVPASAAASTRCRCAPPRRCRMRRRAQSCPRCPASPRSSRPASRRRGRPIRARGRWSVREGAIPASRSDHRHVGHHDAGLLQQPDLERELVRWERHRAATGA